jgi:hypothetical protein
MIKGQALKISPALDATECCFGLRALVAIHSTFANVWRVLETRDVPARFRERCELKAELHRRLMVLASEGITDPAELRRQVLASFPLEAGTRQ